MLTVAHWARIDVNDLALVLTKQSVDCRAGVVDFVMLPWRDTQIGETGWHREMQPSVEDPLVPLQEVPTFRPHATYGTTTSAGCLAGARPLPPVAFLFPPISRGRTRGAAGRYPSEVRRAAVRVMGMTECRQHYAPGLLRAGMVCATGRLGAADACTVPTALVCADVVLKVCAQGDSGAPLVCRVGWHEPWQVVGIVSWGWGPGCAHPKRPGVYTHIARSPNPLSIHCNSMGLWAVSVAALQSIRTGFWRKFNGALVWRLSFGMPYGDVAKLRLINIQYFRI